MTTSIEINKIEFLMKIGRELWDMTNGYQKQPILISKLAERLDVEESRINEILAVGQKIGLLKSFEENKVCIGPVGSVYFIRK